MLVVALPAFYFVGRVIGRIKNGKFERAWRPIMPVIEGATVHVDRAGAAASSRLTGSYRGRSVVAEMAPDMSRSGSYDETGYENRWDVGVSEVPGAHDWTVRWKDAILGMGTTGWSISSEDDSLVERLERAGIRDIVAPLGRGDINYLASDRTLSLHEDIRPMWAPGPVRFRQELDVLVELAAAVTPLNAR